jgi:hypothetical protein
MNSVIIVIVSRPGQSSVNVRFYVGDLFQVVIASASLRGFHRLDTSYVDSLFLRALYSSERVFLRLALSRSVQFITLLPGVTFAFVMAFLATAVVLNVGLIGRPFVRLGSFIGWSFLRTSVVAGTWLAFGGIDLHLLQTVVVILPGGNVPLDLYVRPALVEVSFLFYLSFEESLIDLYS